MRQDPARDKQYCDDELSGGRGVGWGEGRERAPGLNVSVDVKGRSPTELTLVRDALIVIPVSVMRTSMNLV